MAETPGRLFINGRIWKWLDGAGSSTGLDVKGVAETGWFVTGADGRFSAVGSGQPPTEGIVETIDLGGRLVLPGLMDAHIHVGYTGECAEYAQLTDCKSIAEMQSRLREHCARHGDKSWIVGVGWDQSPWGRYPSRHDLDQVESTRPMVLYRACWHIVVANSEALRRADIPVEEKGEAQAWKTVEGGTIDVDGETGLPTGILREAAAPLVTSLVTEERHEVRREYYRRALRRCLSKGLTGVQTNDDKAWGIYRELIEEGELALRVFLTINHSEMETLLAQHPAPSSSLPAVHSAHPYSGASLPPLLSCNRVKLYSDGSLGAETAALRRPYVGTDNVGLLIHNAEELADKVASAHTAGYQLEIHAIGDRAAEVVLDALDKTGVVGPTHRPVLTHCQVLGSDLIGRMARMGVVANIQPSFVGTDAKWVRQRLDPDVQQTSYCWKTLMAAGVYCAGGSDAPIEDCDPLIGIYDAMVRQPHACKPKAQGEAKGEGGGDDGEVFLPHESLTFAEALWLYTIGAAYACRSESELGQVRGGFLADFIVLDRDVTVSPVASLLQARVQEVWVHGTRRTIHDVSGGEAKVDGPYVPGKNGDVGFVARRGWAGGHALEGMRGVRCCGPKGHVHQ